MKKQKDKKREKSTFWKDFKAFISRGNVVDMAVAVVVGAAFTAIVNSVANDIIRPLIALLIDGNFNELVIVLRPEVLDEAGKVITQAITLNYGKLLMAIFTFLIDALVIFTAVRIVRKARKRVQSTAEEIKEFLTKDDDKKDEAAATDEVSAETAVTEAVAEAPVPTAEVPVATASVEQLLTEIRDLLRKENQPVVDADKDKKTE